MRKFAALAVSAAMLALAAASQAASITTLFASNNGGSAGGGTYFDLTVGAQDITITGFDVNTSLTTGNSFGFEVYTRTGSYVGTTGSSAGWTMMSDGVGVSAGQDNPSAVSINSQFTLLAGQTYGIAIAHRGGPGSANQRYTNGTGSNQSYSNADLSLSLGAASNVLFSGSPFSPRVWNGTIHYNVVPEPATMAALGIGLVAVLRRRMKK